MKFVAIVDSVVNNNPDQNCYIRIPTILQIGDVVHIVLSSNSDSHLGEPRKELRIYRLKPDDNKISPRYHLGFAIPSGCEKVFHFSDFGLYLYTYPEKEIQFGGNRSLRVSIGDRLQEKIK